MGQRESLVATLPLSNGRIGKLANSAGLKIRSLVVHGFESHSSHLFFFSCSFLILPSNPGYIRQDFREEVDHLKKKEALF
jgi:hypothetical protein